MTPDLMARWQAALDDFATTMRRDRLADSTCARIVKQVRRFATDVNEAPYDVTAALLVAWLELLTCSRATRYAYRTSLKTFYRWAYRAGRIDQDITNSDASHPLARPVPQAWAAVLRDYARWQRSCGHTNETVAIYAHRLAALARQTGATPWELGTDDLTTWLASHRWARETLRGHRTTLRAFYRWGYETGRIAHNPAQQLPKVRATAPAPRPATEDAYRDALSHADDRARLMLRLAAELGLRRAEVAQVHAADLDTDHQRQAWLLVHGKGNKPRRLPVPNDIAIELRARGSGYAFPGNDHGHLSPRYVGKLVGDLLPQGVSMHALRHRFASRVYAIDRDVFTVQQLLGHTRADTTQRYVQTDAQAMQRLVNLAAGTPQGIVRR